MRLTIATIFFVILAIHRISQPLVVIPLSLMLYDIVKYVFAANFVKFEQIISANRFFFLFLLLVIVGILRNNKPITPFAYTLYQATTFLLLSLALCGLVFYHFKRNPNWPKLVVYFVICPFAIFSLINLVLYFMGVTIQGVNYESNDSYVPDAVLLQRLFGISAKRVVFPLVTGINQYSDYVGAVFSISLTFFFYFKKYRYITGSAAFIFLLTLAFTDSRGALIYPFMINGVIYFINKRKRIRRSWRLATILVVLGPLLLFVALPFLGSLGLFDALSRKSGDIESGNTRFFIWGIAGLEFLNFKFIHLVGWGEYGHFASGASRLWSATSDRENAEFALSPHSTFFSILFDYGYLGLVTYLILIWQSFNKVRYIATRNIKLALPLFSFMLYNIIAGFTESFGGVYLFNYMVLFCVVIIVINVQHYLLKKQELAAAILPGAPAVNQEPIEKPVASQRFLPR